MGGFQPTGEQQAVIDAFKSGGHVLIEAGAGAGKTSTLELLAKASPNERILYLAYNAATAKEGRERMPANVESSTAHSFAMRSLRSSSDPRVKAVLGRLQAPRLPNSQIGRKLGINSSIDVGEGLRPLQPSTQVSLAQQTVRSWCYSGAAQIGPKHVPAVTGVTDAAVQRQVAAQIAKVASRLWELYTNPNGDIRTEHDHYLKLFALRESVWSNYDTVLLDEAQDSNGVVVSMLHHQQHNGRRLTLVGDRYQTLYSWRGAVDGMSQFAVDHKMRLTKSFRFGPAIADEANKWLTLLGTDLRLEGYEKLNSTLGEVTNPDVVLCRKNATAMEKTITTQMGGGKVALVGGGGEIRRLAEAAEDLKTRGSTWHPDLLAFTSWGQVQEYVDGGGGDDLATLVNLVDTYGTQALLSACDRLVDESVADLVVSTAHKAKGREWTNVQVADDFPIPDPSEGDMPDEADMMLAYVTVTRAKGRLDRGSALANVDGLLGLGDTDTTDTAGEATDGEATDGEAVDGATQGETVTVAQPEVGDETATTTDVDAADAGEFTDGAPRLDSDLPAPPGWSVAAGGAPLPDWGAAPVDASGMVTRMLPVTLPPAVWAILDASAAAHKQPVSELVADVCVVVTEQAVIAAETPLPSSATN